MKAGIKYCGGCNPHYDRSAVCIRLMTLLEGDEVEYAEVNRFYDIILVISGCNRACSDHSSLKGRTRIFINSESDYSKAADIILKLKQEGNIELEGNI